MYRSPSLACAAAVAARQDHDNECQRSPAAAWHKESVAVDLASTVYMVNTGGDLTSTQSTFQELFSQQETWQACSTVSNSRLLHHDSLNTARLAA